MTALPNTKNALRGQERRFRVPVLISKPNAPHRFGRFSVPIGGYLDEINECLLRRQRCSDFALVDAVRGYIELTLGIKFRNGRRGFMCWFLKHEKWTGAKASRLCYERERNRRKIKEPTICLNPTVKSAYFTCAPNSVVRLRKGYNADFREAVSGLSDNNSCV